LVWHAQRYQEVCAALFVMPTNKTLHFSSFGFIAAASNSVTGLGGYLYGFY